MHVFYTLLLLPWIASITCCTCVHFIFWLLVVLLQVCAWLLMSVWKCMMRGSDICSVLRSEVRSELNDLLIPIRRKLQRWFLYHLEQSCYFLYCMLLWLLHAVSCLCFRCMVQHAATAVRCVVEIDNTMPIHLNQICRLSMRVEALDSMESY